nr:tyrosine recombinase XerC [Pseudomonadaceae bacterium]
MDGQTQIHREAALASFLRRCDAASTRQAYERELRRFIAWLPAEPDSEVLYDYRDHLRARGLSPTTVRWRVTVARAYLAYLGERGKATSDLADGIKLPKGTSGFAPRVLTAGERKRLLAAPDRRSRRGRRDAAILTCLGLGGLRAGEVCRLNFEDLSLRPEGIQLTVNGKGRKRRLVTIPAGQVTKLLRAYLSSWPEARRAGLPLFWCGQPGHESKRLTVPAIDYLVRKHARAARLEGVSAHSLRHTAASLAIEAGEPLHRLRDRLGHSSVLVTSQYLHTPHRA